MSDKCKHENTTFGKLPGLCDYEFCTDCKMSRAIYEQDASEWGINETEQLIETQKARLSTLETEKSSLEDDILRFNDECVARTRGLQGKVAALEAEVKELEEIETDLNGTVSYAEMGVATWKARAEELEAELKKHQWVSVEEGLPEYGLRVLVYSGEKCYIAACHKGDRDFWMGGNVSHDVESKITHWKPITAPSSGKAAEKKENEDE